MKDGLRFRREASSVGQPRTGQRLGAIGRAGPSPLAVLLQISVPPADTPSMMRESHAPYLSLSLTPREYFRRNCWAAVEGSEPEIEATARLIGGDRMCISTDYPHFD